MEEQYILENQIRDTLRKYMDDEGIVYSDVAKKLGTSRGSFSMFLASRNQTIKLDRIKRICDAIGLEFKIVFTQRKE